MLISGPRSIDIVTKKEQQTTRETRLKAHAAESMQLHNKLLDTSVQLTIHVMYLCHFLSAVSQEKREEEVKK